MQFESNIMHNFNLANGYKGKKVFIYHLILSNLNFKMENKTWIHRCESKCRLYSNGYRS